MLRAANLPLADSSPRGVDEFIKEIFHNYQEILEHQRRLLNAFFDIQCEEYPCINSIVAPLYDAALNWQDAYMEYTGHYPIAEYRMEEAMAMPEFRQVAEVRIVEPECASHLLIICCIALGNPTPPRYAKTSPQALCQPPYLPYPPI